MLRDMPWRFPQEKEHGHEGDHHDHIRLKRRVIENSSEKVDSEPVNRQKAKELTRTGVNARRDLDRRGRRDG